MLATLALRRSLCVATSLNAVQPQIVLSAHYSVGKGKPTPKAVTPAKKAPPPPPARKGTPPPPAKKSTPPPPTGKKPAQNTVVAKKPAAKTPPPPVKKPSPPQGSKGTVVVKAQQQAAKEKAKEKAQKEKERDKEARERQREKERLAKEKAKEKEDMAKEKERDRKLKEKEKEQQHKEKEKEKEKKLIKKERADREKQEIAEKKREEKAKKDAMPSRPKSAYICFAVEARPTIVKENPQLPVTAVLGEIAKRWTALPKDKRQKYDQLAEQDRARFERELKEFKKSYPDPPKRALSAFSIFVQENSAIIKKAQPKAKVTEIMKQLSKQWNTISADKKKKYEDAAAQDRVRYLKEKEEFDDEHGK
uniref:Mitochondrial DNA packaging protein n=1 Tax=Physarum polycephalum TaxID=5791 RepID=Q8T114_PHYPO|nr:mitochondrial DNA packaging protein [Physarum polycephalum]